MKERSHENKKTRGIIEVVLKDKKGAKIQRLTCAKRRFAQFASQTAFSTGTLGAIKWRVK